MSEHIFEGSGVAIITPMNPDGSVNFDELGRIIDFQIENGTDAIITCGTTGESATLNNEEHCEVIEYTIKKVAHRVPVIAGAGSNDTNYAIGLSKHAQTVGADAILSVTPYYNKTSQAGLIRHYTAIADNVDIPIILYNVPSRTGCNIKPETYYELSKHPNIKATKEANGDTSALVRTMALCGDNLDIYSGEDSQAFTITAMGGKGVISVFANICPKESHELAPRLRCRLRLCRSCCACPPLRLRYLLASDRGGLRPRAAASRPHIKSTTTAPAARSLPGSFVTM